MLIYYSSIGQPTGGGSFSFYLFDDSVFINSNNGVEFNLYTTITIGTHTEIEEGIFPKVENNENDNKWALFFSDNPLAINNYIIVRNKVDTMQIIVNPNDEFKGRLKYLFFKKGIFSFNNLPKIEKVNDNENQNKTCPDSLKMWTKEFFNDTISGFEVLKLVKKRNNIVILNNYVSLIYYLENPGYFFWLEGNFQDDVLNDGTWIRFDKDNNIKQIQIIENGCYIGEGEIRKNYW